MCSCSILQLFQCSKEANETTVILDTRPSNEYRIAHLNNSINLPLSEIEKADRNGLLSKIKQNTQKIFVVCHRGNDSQLAAKELDEKLGGNMIIRDVVGGLEAWAKRIDPEFPIY